MTASSNDYNKITITTITTTITIITITTTIITITTTIITITIIAITTIKYLNGSVCYIW